MKRYLLALHLVFCPLLVAESMLLQDIKTLSSDKMQGRKTGTEGSAIARDFIAQRFKSLALRSFDQGYISSFIYTSGWTNRTGENIVGWLEGCHYPQHYIVITAHYDHLGGSGRRIYHGADDNASGVAAMLEIARQLSEDCPAYSYIFVATDAEEGGLFGAKAFVAQPPVQLEQILLNINLDMIARSEWKKRLYITGINRFPALMAWLKQQQLAVRLQFLSHRGPGNLTRGTARANWIDASDHAPFHRAGIPYLFFGGQEHPQYHTVEDQWQRIDPKHLNGAMQAIELTIRYLDQQPVKFFHRSGD